MHISSTEALAWASPVLERDTTTKVGVKGVAWQVITEFCVLGPSQGVKTPYVGSKAWRD